MIHDVNKENSKYVANGILEISPVHAKSGKLQSFQFAENYPESNVLICSKFQESLHLDFGTVPLRTTKKVSFQLKNPSKNKAVKLALDRYNEKAGLHIILDTNESNTVNIEPSSTKEGTIYWTPVSDCMMRVVIGFKMDDRAPLQVIAQGTAGTGIEIITPKDCEANLVQSKSLITKKSNPPLSTTFASPTKKVPPPSKTYGKVVKSGPLSPEPTSRLQSPVAKSPRKKVSNNNSSNNHKIVSMKSSTTNKVIDSKWAEKQANNFKDWMNFTFNKSQQMQEAPSEVTVTEVKDVSTLAESNVNNATNTASDSSESQSYASTFRLLLQKRMDAKVQQAGIELYQSEYLQSVINSVNREVDSGRLSMREDRDIHADLGQQEILFSLLFSYELQWLKIGLQIVLNQFQSAKNGKISEELAVVHGSVFNQKIKLALKTFIFENLFGDKEISDQFSKHKLLYVAQEKKMKELLRFKMLKKLFALILFLDNAKTSGLLPKPTLFIREAVVKSSKDVVNAICRSFLRGEGDIVRHLSLMGYTLPFVQTFVDEFDYSVQNLALDLRDGVRLARLYELLTNKKSLTLQLRVPAVSRLQKLHNVSLVINTLYRAEEVKPNSKHIVDGQRDVTLMLLWKLLFTFELRMLITPERVMQEVKAIRKRKSWRRSIYTADEAAKLSVKVLVYADDSNTDANFTGDVQTTLHTHKAVDKVSGDEDDCDKDDDTLDHNPKRSAHQGREDEKLSNALLKWCCAIAEQYHVPVFDFTTCLADGRALCLLIHYYHPRILATKKIKKTTAHLIESSLRKNSTQKAKDGCSLNFNNAELQHAIAGERRNFSLLRKACLDIGGIPLMLPEHYDSKNIPEEKTMIIFLGYLFARLIESAEQVNSAIKIQKAFRKHLRIVNARRMRKEAIANRDKGQQQESLIEVSSNITSMSAENAAVIIFRALKIYVWRRRAYFEKQQQAIELVKSENDDADDSADVMSESDVEEPVSAVQTPSTAVKSSTSTLTSSVCVSPFCSPFDMVDYIVDSSSCSSSRSFCLESIYCNRENVLQLNPAENCSDDFEKNVKKESPVKENDTENCFYIDNIYSLKETFELAISPSSDVLHNVFSSNSAESVDRSNKVPTKRMDRHVLLTTPHRLASRSRSNESLMSSLTKDDRVVDTTATPGSFSSDFDVPMVLMGENEEELIWMKRMETEVNLRTELELRLFREASARRHAEQTAKEAIEDKRVLEERLKHCNSFSEGTAVECKTPATKQRTAEESSRLLERTVMASLALTVEKDLQMRADKDARIAAETRAQHEEEGRLLAERKLQDLLLSNEEEKLHSHSRSADIEAEEMLHHQSEELVRLERDLRMQFELNMQTERMARIAAEEKLQELQDAQRQREEDEEKKKFAIQREERRRIESIKRVQHQWRRYKTHKRSCKFKASVIRVQTSYRRFRERKVFLDTVLPIRKEKNLQMFKQSYNAASAIASIWRTHSQRMAFKQARSKCIAVQACYRRYNCLKIYRKQLASIVKIQKNMRGILVRHQFHRQMISIIIVQTILRRFIVQKQFLRRKQAVRSIQTFWRKAASHMHKMETLRKQMQISRDQERRQKHAIVVVCRFIQLALKRLVHVKAARKVQRWFRSFRVLIRARKMVRGFRRLVAVHRAKVIKSRNSAKVTALVEKIKNSALRAKTDPGMKLGKQTQHALQVLENSNGKMISHVLRACQILELSTQFSRLCCEAFAEASASNILFELLRSCNRSTPHQELLRISLVVLLHVGRHEHLAPMVATANDTADVLVDLMQMFRDKKSIFVLAAELLSRLVYASLAVKDTCNSPLYKKRLEGILHIIERKNRVEVRVKTATGGSNASAGGVNGVTAVTGTSSANSNNTSDEFDMYKGKLYHRIEPILCIQHMLKLLHR